MVSIICRNPKCGDRVFSVKPCDALRRFYCSRLCHDSHKNDLLYIYDRFWSHVGVSNSDACWGWSASFDLHGYGQFVYRKGKKTWRIKSSIFAYRFPWDFPGIERPLNSLCVLHACDNPPCCNPSHLFLGTQKDNVADMVRKKRNVFGASHISSKITDADVLEIRRRRNSGELYKDIARDFPLSESSIRKIAIRMRWKHLP